METNIDTIKQDVINSLRELGLLYETATKFRVIADEYPAKEFELVEIITNIAANARIKPIIKETTFKQELSAVINRFSKENGSNTPDWILAEYLSNCLAAFDQAYAQRDLWYTEDKT